MKFLLSLLLSTQCFAGTPNFKKVVQIVFENAGYAEALKEPYFASVASQGALFNNYSAVTHPSQPNYIAMIAGDPLGTLMDGQVNLQGDHLGTLLTRKGLSWKNYAEDYPGNCFLGMQSGAYARKHVPFISFVNVQSNPSECAKVVNAEAFASDLRAGTLPTYSLYVPNLNHDGHDTSAAYASNWLSSAFGAIFSDSRVMKDTLFIITFDESDSYIRKNQVYTVLLGANVIPGSAIPTPVNHYSVLRLIEDQFQLGSLGRNDARAVQIPNIWR